MAEADPKITVPVAALRANLRGYLKMAEAGASFVIVSRGKPVAVLGPDEPAAEPATPAEPENPPAKLPPRVFGQMKGQFTIPDDFDTLPDDILESFYSSKLYGET